MYFQLNGFEVKPGNLGEPLFFCLKPISKLTNMKANREIGQDCKALLTGPEKKTQWMNRATMMVATIAIILCCQSVLAQQVSFKITRDDPEQAIQDLYIGLDPLWLELGGQNLLSMGWGGYAFYNMSQDLMFELDFRTPYHRRWLDAEYYEIDEEGKREKEDYYNDFKPRKLMQVQAIAHWTFGSKTRANRPMKAHVKSETHGDYTVESSLPFRGTKKRLYQVRGGLFYNRTTVARDVPNPEMFQDLLDSPNDFTEVPYTNMSYTALVGGINLSRVYEAVVDIDGYGTRTCRAHNTFYVDVLFAPAIRLRNMSVGGQEYDLVDNNHFGKQNLGWRLGWGSMPDYKNFTWGTEFGNRPGIYKTDASGVKQDLNRGVYWNIWMAFPIYAP